MDPAALYFPAPHTLSVVDVQEWPAEHSVQLDSPLDDVKNPAKIFTQTIISNAQNFVLSVPSVGLVNYVFLGCFLEKYCKSFYLIFS